MFSNIGCILFLTLMLVDAVQAGAWVRPEHSQLHIATYRYYQTESFYNEQGERETKDGRFTKHEVQYYSEYGITDELMLGASLIASQQQDFQRFAFARAGDPASQTTELRGLTTTEFFAAYQLYRDDAYAVALQGLIGLPPYFVQDEPDDLITDNKSMEISALIGRNFKLFDRQHYIDAQFAYRHRSGALGDQYRFNLLAGFNLNEDWTIMPEVQHVEAADAIQQNLFTITGQNDYDLTKLQGSVLYRATEQIFIQGGVFSHIAGNNTGGGGGAQLSLWFQL